MSYPKTSNLHQKAHPNKVINQPRHQPLLSGTHISTHATYAWFTILFIAALFLGHSLRYGVESISVLWPASGILSATLAILPKKHWIPIILIAAVIDFLAWLLSHNFVIDPQFKSYLFVGQIAGPITALVFATSFRYLIPSGRPLSEPRRFAIYVCIPITLNTAVTSFLSMCLLSIFIEDLPILAAWQQWWYSDLAGHLIFATPIIVICNNWNRIKTTHAVTFEASIAMLLFIIVASLLFTNVFQNTFFTHYKFVLMLPIYAWFISRFGSSALALTNVSLSIVILAALVNHQSPFEHYDTPEAINVLAVQGFIVPMTLTTLYIATILQQRRDQFDQLLNNERQIRNLSRIESLGTMAGGVAHDFGNLAIAMRAYHAVLRLEIKEPNESVIKAIQGLDEAADGAQQLTKSLMAFARDEQADTHDEPAIADLCLAVTDATNALRPLMTDDNPLKIDVPDHQLFVPARSADLQRVLSNLILNARDASRASQPIEITVKQYDHRVWLLVTDHGTGMSKETQEHLFDPFYTTKPRGQGTGLGLAVVSGIIRDMGGTINVASTLGQGTTIAIDMPVIKA